MPDGVGTVRRFRPAVTPARILDATGESAPEGRVVALEETA